MSEQPVETEIETVEAPQYPYDPAPEPPDDNDDAIDDGVEATDENA